MTNNKYRLNSKAKSFARVNSRQKTIYVSHLIYDSLSKNNLEVLNKLSKLHGYCIQISISNV